MPARASLRISLAAACLAAALTLAPPARAETATNEALVGAGSVLATLLYGPTKLLYAAGGSVVAGLAWLWSAGDSDVMSPILTAAVRGDYVITPAHLTGAETIEFVGRSPEQRRARDSMLLEEEVIVEPVYQDSF